MSDDQPPIYAGFVTRATGLVVDEVLILVIGVAGVIGAGLVLDAVIPGGVSIDLASIVGAAAWSVVLSTAYFVGFWSLGIFALCVVVIHGLVVYGEPETR